MDPNAQQPQAPQPAPETPRVDPPEAQPLPPVPAIPQTELPQVAPAPEPPVVPGSAPTPEPVVPPAAPEIPVAPIVETLPVEQPLTEQPVVEQVPAEASTPVESAAISEPTTSFEPAAFSPETTPAAPETSPAPEVPIETPIAPEPTTQPEPTASLPQFPQSLDETAPVAIQQPPAPQPVPPATPLIVPAPKKKTGLIIGIVAGGIILIAAVAVTLLLLAANAGKITEADLVTAKDDDTVYLRPKQWQAITVNTIAGYGDKKGKNDTSTALMAVQKKNYVKSGINSATDSELATFRDTVTSSMTSSNAEEAVKETGSSCTSTEDVTVTKSSVKTTNMVGLLRIDGTCVRDDGKFHVVIYVTLGDDGYLRSVVLMSTESLWKLNETVFNKMLESTNQV